jgi:sec-independent protein translocase protein TatB
VFSVSPAELITIAIVILLVFGPRRLPDIARRAGKVLRDVRSAATELKTGIEAEYKDVIDPVADATKSVKDALSGIDDSGDTAAADKQKTTHAEEQPDGEPGAAEAENDPDEDDQEGAR